MYKNITFLCKIWKYWRIYKNRKHFCAKYGNIGEFIKTENIQPISQIISKYVT
jgi:hypothetical protein